MHLRALTLGSLAALAMALGAGAGASGCAAPAGDDGAATQDGALGQMTRPWDASAEDDFSRWIAAIGEARAAGRCATLDACIDDPAINPLRSAADPDLELFADCADVPMELRAYFAVKTGRPFAYVSAIASDDPAATDTRYTPGNHPTGWSVAGGSSSMQSLLSRVSAVVHSGFYRTAPEIEGTDTYPIDPSPTSLRPGSVFYDPNGHVLVVYRVEPDGTVWMFDGHPDNSLTYGPLTQGKYAVGGRAQGGGFRNFRPLRVGATGRLEYAANAELADFGATQYGHGDQYVAWLRAKISTGPGPTPEKQMNELVDQLCVDLGARVASVAAASALAEGPLGELPPNIYAARGEWEALSTPSRDARLRASVRTIYAFVKANAKTPAMVRTLGQVWREHQASPRCAIAYTNSAAEPVTLTLEDVVARIYDLSFDPYHCPEMRWGAYPAPATRAELATCSNADAEHLARWEAERRNRNVIDRPAGVTETGPDFGPDTPEDIDVPGLFRRLGLR
jgi:hypothetical protein